ncbi:late competence development ComFB family protein [Dongshaea marina]|uniref:late competence development ComFB family protein n=1 Tax=Dongshaea marina TaxID=2047966 RepID=UPI00131F210A|nr:late competence development ComFB family protein [Dongshaea marina]
MGLDEDIHNLYESLVIQQMDRMGLNETYNEMIIADLCCLTLNKLPTKYIRSRVDALSHLTERDSYEIESLVRSALLSSLDFIKKDPRVAR